MNENFYFNVRWFVLNYSSLREYIISKLDHVKHCVYAINEMQVPEQSCVYLKYVIKFMEIILLANCLMMIIKWVIISFYLNQDDFS
jgi:hypothetical protein